MCLGAWRTGSSWLMPLSLRDAWDSYNASWFVRHVVRSGRIAFCFGAATGGSVCFNALSGFAQIHVRVYGGRVRGWFRSWSVGPKVSD